MRGAAMPGHGQRRNREPLLAIQHAAEMVELEPFRETAYQLLMKMHAAAGDRAEALRVFAKCRELLRDELGVSPSPQTEAVYLEICAPNNGGPNAAWHFR